MTVASTQSHIEYTGDGATQTFAVPFYFILNSNISVTVADADGNLDELTYGTDFSASGGGNADGGSVTLNKAYDSTYTILIYRNPPATQETVYYENGKFPAKSHERALDKLTMLIQRYGGWFDTLALKKPNYNYLAKYYDAQGNRIANLADPVNVQDATTKGYVDYLYDEFSKKADLLEDAFKNGLYGYITVDSFQDGATLTLPNQVLRWKLPDGDGEHYRWDGGLPKVVPAGSTPETSGGIGTGKWLSVGDAVLRGNLSEIDGTKLISICPSIKELKLINASAGERVQVKGYHPFSGVGGGDFVYVESIPDGWLDEGIYIKSISMPGY